MANKDLAMGAAGGALVATLFSNINKARAAPAPTGIDPQVWDMMLAQQEQLAQLIGALTNLTVQLGGTASYDSIDAFANYDNFTTGQVICPVLGRAVQLPSIPIPKNKQLVVKALPGNAGWVFVGVRAAEAQNQLVAYPMLAQEAVGLAINNASSVWVTSQNINEGIAFIVEQA